MAMKHSSTIDYWTIFHSLLLASFVIASSARIQRINHVFEVFCAYVCLCSYSAVVAYTLERVPGPNVMVSNAVNQIPRSKYFRVPGIRNGSKMKRFHTNCIRSRTSESIGSSKCHFIVSCLQMCMLKWVLFTRRLQCSPKRCQVAHVMCSSMKRNE